MRKYLITIGLVFFALVQSYAQNQTIISGEIKDSVQTIPYASVYMKNNSTVGVMAGNDGKFELSVPNNILPDTLVVSFVGYHPYYAPISASADTTAISAVLKEEIIQLSDITIEATGKYKKKVEMEKLIEMIKEQFLKDFENTEARYHAKTEASMAFGGQICVYQENTMDIYEKNRHEKDMSLPLTSRVYINPKLIESIENDSTLLDDLDKDLDEIEEESKKSKKKKGKEEEEELASEEEEDLDSLDLMTSNIKGLSVSPNSIEKIFNYINPKKWSYEGHDDKYHYVTHSQKIGFLGIIRIREKHTLFVEKSTYSIKHANVVFSVYLNIPFGKKMPKEVVDLINLFNIAGDKKLTKFRLRKIDATFNLSSDFVRIGELMYRGDTFSYGEAKITSPKEELLLEIKWKQMMESIDTKSPTPITEEETKKEPVVEIIDDL